MTSTDPIERLEGQIHHQVIEDPTFDADQRFLSQLDSFLHEEVLEQLSQHIQGMFIIPSTERQVIGFAKKVINNYLSNYLHKLIFDVDIDIEVSITPEFGHLEVIIKPFSYD